MLQHHNMRQAFVREFATPGLWWSRTVVIGAATLAGLTVVAFTWLAESALEVFQTWIGARWWAALLWTPLACAAIVWATRRYAPGASGSGIPQVLAALDPKVRNGHRGLFASLRLSAAKILLTSAGLLAGLSLGREGPSVQIAAGVMLAARRFLPRRSGVSAHSLLVAGGAAGIAAAFNTPLAGVMFAIEEMSRSPERRSSGLIIVGIVLAGLIAISVHGNGPYFGIIHAGPIGAALFLPGLMVALASGVTGGLFARLLLASLGGASTDRFTRLRQAHPVAFAAACGGAVAIIGVVSHGATYGSGNAAAAGLLRGEGDVAGGFAFLKFLATWLTVWSGVPAGIFAPSLSIGAALGNFIALLAAYPYAPALIALGMVGFLAAATQAPLTAFIIVMEMVDGHGMVLSLMACAAVASSVSRVLSPPLYAALADLQLRRLPDPPVYP